MRIAILAAITILTLINPAHAESDPIDAHVDAMFDALKGRPDYAVREAELVIEEFTTRFADSDTKYFCGDSQVQMFILVSLPLDNSEIAKGKSKITVLDAKWCEAYFVKGFALVDMGRTDEAEPMLRRATELAPLNSWFMSEYAEISKGRRDWQKAYELFSAANDLAQYSDENRKAKEKARALRGMGFAQIELGDLKAANDLFNESLAFEPDSPAAAHELAYIARLQAIRD